MWHFDSMHGPVAVAMAQVAGIAARLPVDRLEGSFLLPTVTAGFGDRPFGYFLRPFHVFTEIYP